VAGVMGRLYCNAALSNVRGFAGAIDWGKAGGRNALPGEQKS